MPIPQFDTENPKMISQGPSVCVFNKTDPQEVLAAWLFTQYLLTDDVQIAYSQTEGYIPVTSKAHNTDVYRDYLSRIGEDNELYYDIKINAANLLLENIENTFVTPVFNGSASLRNAAGQLIENVTKSVRRGETIDEGYMEELYDDVTSLYRLDQGGKSDMSTGKKELGPLPSASIALIAVLIGVWLIMGVYVITVFAQKRIKNKA